MNRRFRSRLKPHNNGNTYLKNPIVFIKKKLISKEWKAQNGWDTCSECIKLERNDKLFIFLKQF